MKFLLFHTPSVTFTGHGVCPGSHQGQDGNATYRFGLVLVDSDAPYDHSLPCSHLAMVEKLFSAGADVFRLNFSHGSHEQSKIC
jgi:pyruvate kinase